VVFDHGLATYQAIYLVYNIRISDTYIDTYPAPIFKMFKMIQNAYLFVPSFWECFNPLEPWGFMGVIKVDTLKPTHLPTSTKMAET